MKKTSKARGDSGEELALNYLISKGYLPVVRNYRYKRCEIDLIVSYPPNLLVFVEVKLRNTKAFGYPEQMVSEAQIDRIQEAAGQFLFESETPANIPIRFDILSIVEKDGKVAIEHFQDAF